VGIRIAVDIGIAVNVGPRILESLFVAAVDVAVEERPFRAAIGIGRNAL
jgi:hypothetical protein